MNISEERKTNDSLRLFQGDRTSMQGHGHPAGHSHFRTASTAGSSAAKERKGSGENEAAESCTHISLQRTREGVFISPKINSQVSGCLQTYLSNLCGLK